MNISFRFFSFCFFLPAFGLALAVSPLGPAHAQTPRPPRLPSASAPYLLGPDDVLSIQVSNFPELCVTQVTVPSDGKISVPTIGALSVAGKTTAQVAETLAERWAPYYVTPLVNVTLTQRRHQSVQVNGYVTRIGPVEYQPNLRLMEALASAGGAAENGDLSHVTVTHPDGETQAADVSGPQSAGDPAQDIILVPDDVVYVPQLHLQVSILGEVAKPGSYEYKDKMTVLDALTDADNVNVKTADLSNATLIHNGTEQPLDLKALLVQGQLADNVALAPGDRIFVPLLHNRIYVDGAIRTAGYYAFQPGDRLQDAISGSGGTIAGVSDLKKVTVVHQDKKNNTVIAETVDFGKFLQRGDMSVNLPLQPDDAIYVPVKGTNPNVLQELGSAIGIGTGVRVLGGH